MQNILEKVVHRAFRIVEYRKEKRRKQEVAGNIAEKIVDSIIKRGEKIVDYKRKVREKKKKECAGYPSVINWLQPKHPAGNQTAGLSSKDGAKCGNEGDKNERESNQTAGVELKLGLECRRNCPPGQDIKFDTKFNHNPTSTKSRIKGGKKENKIYSTKGAKRKATELEGQCQPDDVKRRRYGPMDRHIVINNSAKSGCNDPEVTMKANSSKSFNTNYTLKD